MKTKICSVKEVRKDQYVVFFICDQCGIMSVDRKSHFDLKVKHFCNRICYSLWRKEAPPEQQPTWKGGVSNTEAHRRWKRKNPKRMAHLKARRYAREKGADGSHSLEQWEFLKFINNNLCVGCKMDKPLTKDHMIPLSKGGTDFINNIQPLCRNCNSKKHNNIHENPELREGLS